MSEAQAIVVTDHGAGPSTSIHHVIPVIDESLDSQQIPLDVNAPIDQSVTSSPEGESPTSNENLNHQRSDASTENADANTLPE